MWTSVSPLRDYEFAWGFDSGVVCSTFTMDKKEQMNRSNKHKKQKSCQILKGCKETVKRLRQQSTSEWEIFGQKARKGHVGVITDREEEETDVWKLPPIPTAAGLFIWGQGEEFGLRN